MNTKDKLTKDLIKVVDDANEPLETKEIEAKLPTATRTKIVKRLMESAIKGLIKGKTVGSGKKTWVWWRKDAFTKKEMSWPKQKETEGSK
jgi:hypothetical protein